jgi:hypothetical protein
LLLIIYFVGPFNCCQLLKELHERNLVMKNSICNQLGLAFVMSVVLAGCQKQMEAPKVNSSTGSIKGADDSVAKPSMVPPSDAGIKPAVPEATSSQPSGAVKDMSKRQESSAMPMPGQANDDSPTTIYKSK